MRGFADRRYRDTRFAILVRFNEAPPGSRASAAVTAMTALIFIWVIGHITSDHGTVTNSDLPAIVLALPAIAASWFGLSAGTDALVGSSLHARLSLVFSGVLSVASVITYLLQDAFVRGSDVGRTPRSGHLFVAGVDNVTWFVLLVLAFLGFLYSSWHLLARVRNYLSLIQRTDPLSADHGLM
jgi:DMSO reductase anchor subunit